MCKRRFVFLWAALSVVVACRQIPQPPESSSATDVLIDTARFRGETSLGAPLDAWNAPNVVETISAPQFLPSGASISFVSPSGTIPLADAGSGSIETVLSSPAQGHVLGSHWWIDDRTLAVFENWLTPEQMADHAAHLPNATEFGLRLLDVTDGATIAEYSVHPGFPG